uniref:Amidase domain-containing protein n=1 Tax=Corethron hystrix TaxID=216773 RepID=A0A7S1FVQ2_9STRA|mmetsp:Transcript_32268/g.74299  ORF Transcript_32268/g.74299 Transcript_32268/m.74299 type:complete len:959 (+) Transcript_32268:118-2994(+)
MWTEIEILYHVGLAISFSPIVICFCWATLASIRAVASFFRSVSEVRARKKLTNDFMIAREAVVHKYLTVIDTYYVDVGPLSKQDEKQEKLVNLSFVSEEKTKNGDELLNSQRNDTVKVPSKANQNRRRHLRNASHDSKFSASLFSFLPIKSLYESSSDNDLAPFNNSSYTVPTGKLETPERDDRPPLTPSSVCSDTTEFNSPKYNSEIDPENAPICESSHRPLNDVFSWVVGKKAPPSPSTFSVKKFKKKKEQDREDRKQIVENRRGQPMAPLLLPASGINAESEVHKLSSNGSTHLVFEEHKTRGLDGEKSTANITPVQCKTSPNKNSSQPSSSSFLSMPKPKENLNSKIYASAFSSSNFDNRQDPFFLQTPGTNGFESKFVYNKKERSGLNFIKGVGNDNDMTAIQIVDAVSNGKICPVSLVVKCARKCVKYGRGPRWNKNSDWAKSCANSFNKVKESNKDQFINGNYIFQEFYDEAFESAKKLAPKKERPRVSNITKFFDAVSSIKDHKPDPENKDENSGKAMLGVPICISAVIPVKNGFFLKGSKRCCLVKANSYDNDALIVQTIRNAGALPILSSHVSDFYSFLSMEKKSRKSIYHRKKISPCSGDAALVAMKCVPLAVSVDFCGSLLISAAWEGIVGFKPTPSRITKKNTKFYESNMTICSEASIGTFSRTVGDCELFLRTVCVEEVFNKDIHRICPIKFNQNCSRGEDDKMKIGYILSFALEPCHAAKRGLFESVAALTNAKHECVPFVPPINVERMGKLLKLLEILAGLCKHGGFGSVGDTDTEFHGHAMFQTLKLLLDFSTQQTSNGDIRFFTDKSFISSWETCSDLLNKMRKEWAKEFEICGFDAVIFPSLPIPTCPIEMNTENFNLIFHSMLISSFLLWPAGVVPVTVVGKSETDCSLENDTSKFSLNHVSEGLPITLTVMTKAYQDEKCLLLMKEIERHSFGSKIC